jgi:hypothetical protein
LQFQAPANYFGGASVLVTLVDGSSAKLDAKVLQITVAPVNDAPAAAAPAQRTYSSFEPRCLCA